MELCKVLDGPDGKVEQFGELLVREIVQGSLPWDPILVRGHDLVGKVSLEEGEKASSSNLSE